jgi:ABC-type lipoprotein release transport system permease subunit
VDQPVPFRLTILGIVIGITTVVVVASLLTGLRAGIVTFFDELGPDNIFIYKTSGDPNQFNEPPKERKRRQIKKEYADVIRRYAGTVGGRGDGVVYSAGGERFVDDGEGSGV